MSCISLAASTLIYGVPTGLQYLQMPESIMSILDFDLHFKCTRGPPSKCF